MSTKKSIFGCERIEICFPSNDDPFFKLGRVNYSKAHRPIDQHIHNGMMEFVFLIKGKQVYSVGGCEYTINSGEIFVTFANELHSSGLKPEDKSQLYYLIIDIEKLKCGFIACNENEAVLVAQSLYNIKRRVFKGVPEMKTILDRIITTFYGNGSYKETLIRNLISDLIIITIENEEKYEEEPDNDMQYILDYIDRNICEDVSISTLAEIACLSETRMKINFRQKIGIPPREYILRRKVEIAKVFLKESNKSITEIAHELSFSSSQYFSTVFKRFTFMSPNEFKSL